MKKAFTLVVLIVTPTMAFAQGTVTFQNATGLVKESLGGGGLIPVPAGYAMVELISAPVGTSLPGCGVCNYPTLASFLAANPGWSAGTPLTGSSNPGGLIHNGLFANGNLSLNVPGRTAAEYLVIGWLGPNGGPVDGATSYDTAMALGCWFAQSAIFTTQTGDPTATPPDLPVNLKNSFGGLIFAGPEPSTFALAGLGALMLMLFGRRRQFPS